MQQANLKINKFLGIRNDNSGDTTLKIGELSKMQNFKIAEGYTAVKRNGYTQMLTTAFSNKIDGMWYGKINGNNHLVAASGGGIYVVGADGVAVQIGTMTQGKTNFSFFNDALYIQNGIEYMKFTADIEEIPSVSLFDSTTYASTYPATVTAATATLVKISTDIFSAVWLAKACEISCPIT